MSSSKVDPAFEALLHYLKHYRGCDLTGYKRSTLMRRFRHRMRQLNIEEYPAYLQYLQLHTNEYRALLNEVLINVTSFFRDREAWNYLATEIIPQLIANQPPHQPLRIWSAGCAAGQEIYSLLILLAEALGVEACLQRVQCYATDADEAALRQARYGMYSDLEVTGVPRNWLEKYFQHTDEGYIFHPQLRRTIIFGRHDLARDAPISKIDLLTCRNVLIYFNQEIQLSILARLHFALKHTGFLFLGKAETLNHRRPIFTAVDLNHHIYKKGLDLDLEDHLYISPHFPKSGQESAPELSAYQSRFWQTAFETSPVAQLMIDTNGNLISTNEQANRWFELSFNDWQRPFRDLELGKQLSLQVFNQPFHRQHHPVTSNDIEWSSGTITRYFDITIAPVYDVQQKLLGMMLTFQDVTERKHLREKLKRADADLAQLKQTLQITTSKLNSTRIELEAAYQEIKLLEGTSYTEPNETDISENNGRFETEADSEIGINRIDVD